MTSGADDPSSAPLAAPLATETVTAPSPSAGVASTSSTVFSSRSRWPPAMKRRRADELGRERIQSPSRRTVPIEAASQ